MASFRQKCMLFFILLSCIGFAHKDTVHAAGNMLSLPETVQEGDIYEVSPDGTKDFRTIQEGVDSAESGDTLLIYPGIYEENVVIEDKTVNLIGVNPQYCILTANSDNYHRVPLTIAAGRVSNLTICGTSAGNSNTDLPGTAEWISSADTDLAYIYAWQDQYSGYVIHVDQPYCTGRTLSIENCRIISENNYCIGLGCWDSTEIQLTNCELIAGGSSGCIFLHNTKYTSEVGTAHVTIRNSSFKNYVGPYVMVIHSEGKNNPIALTFQNVKVSTVAYEYDECYNTTNVNTGVNIDQLESPAVQAMLAETGYLNLSNSEQLVHRCTTEQQIEFNNALGARSSPLKGWPQLAEGITYWKSAAASPVVSGRVRHSIDMKNADGGTGDGWCGLSGVYLTEDSYGNTLPEMNYPRVMLGSAAD